MGLGSLLYYWQLGFAVENRPIIWQTDVIYFFLSVENTVIFFGQCCQTLLLPWEKDEPLQCNRFENVVTVSKPLCQEILRGFRLTSYSETNRKLSCETGSPFDSSQSEHTDPLKIRPQTGGKNCSPIALGGHGLNVFQRGIGEGFWTCSIKACSLCSGHGAMYICENWDNSSNYRVTSIEAGSFLDWDEPLNVKGIKFRKIETGASNGVLLPTLYREFVQVVLDVTPLS